MSVSYILPVYQIMQVALPVSWLIHHLSSLQSARTSANIIRNDYMFSSKLLIQVLNSERPANDPRGTPLYTHRLSDDSLHPSPFGGLSASKPFSVGHCSFCLWIKMWRRPAQKTTAPFIRQVCNLGKVKYIKLIWQGLFSLGSGR